MICRPARPGISTSRSRTSGKEELNGFLRAGSCMGCHTAMSKKDLWKKVST